jgi:hypothetical protein
MPNKTELKFHTERTFDAFTDKETLPYTDKRRHSTTSKYPFDFLFTKDGTWLYASSFESMDDGKMHKWAVAILNTKEHWRIVRSATGEIIREG